MSVNKQSQNSSWTKSLNKQIYVYYAYAYIVHRRVLLGLYCRSITNEYVKRGESVHVLTTHTRRSIYNVTDSVTMLTFWPGESQGVSGVFKATPTMVGEAFIFYL